MDRSHVLVSGAIALRYLFILGVPWLLFFFFFFQPWVVDLSSWPRKFSSALLLWYSLTESNWISLQLLDEFPAVGQQDPSSIGMIEFGNLFHFFLFDTYGPHSTNDSRHLVFVFPDVVVVPLALCACVPSRWCVTNEFRSGCFWPRHQPALSATSDFWYSCGVVVAVCHHPVKASLFIPSFVHRALPPLFLFYYRILTWSFPDQTADLSKSLIAPFNNLAVINWTSYFFFLFLNKETNFFPPIFLEERRRQVIVLKRVTRWRCLYLFIFSWKEQMTLGEEYETPPLRLRDGDSSFF